MLKDKDYIGPDPVRWVDRLLVVNEKSQFTPEQRGVIEVRLTSLREELFRASAASK